MQVTASVVGEGTHEIELSSGATYGDVVREVGYSTQEATVLVDGTPVPDDATIEAAEVTVLRLIKGGSEVDSRGDARPSGGRFEAAVIDLDGTVYRGARPIAGAPEAITTLQGAGITPVFLSNNATKRPDQYCRTLVDLGIDVRREQVLNSAAIAAAYLAAEHGEDPTYVVGPDALCEELRAAGIPITDDPAATDVLLASLDRSFDYATLSDVLEANRRNTPALYATNPDRTCPVDGGEIPDCKAIIGAIEGLLGREVTVLGKPSPVTVDVALDRIDTEPERCLLIGDRLETDVRMGERAGMETVLVRTGVTDDVDLAASTLEPDHVLDSIAEIGTVVAD